MAHVHAPAGAPAEYTAVAKLLHWLIAAFILVQIPLGLVMVNMREANEAANAAGGQPPYSILQIFDLYQFHKSLGITVLGLVILRLLWRLVMPPPQMPGSMPEMERKAAHAGHIALYLLMFGLPLTGWALVSVESDTPLPTILYRTVQWPHIPGLADLPKDAKATLDPLLTSTHAVLGWILLGVAVIHILAACRHAFILKDGVMSRMLPRVSRKSRILVPALAAMIGASALLAQPGRSYAYEWSVQPEKSKIEFIASAGGSEYRGTISTYKAEVLFDPEAPHITSVRLAMDTAGLTFGRKDYDEAVQGEDWFDVKNYPRAFFASNSAKASGNDDEFVLDGKLTLKGATKGVSVPMTIKIDEGEAAVTGETTISRAQFNIGPVSFAGIPVDDKVRIVFDFSATQMSN